MNSRPLACAFALALLLPSLATDARARNTEHFYPVNSAVESALGRERLLDIPFYFAGQKHPKAAKVVGEWKANRSSRGVFRTDESSCQTAFLSAVIALQERARREAADANEIRDTEIRVQSEQAVGRRLGRLRLPAA